MKFNRTMIVCMLAFACCEGAVPFRPPGRSLLFFPLFTKPLPHKPFSIFSRPHQPPPSDEQQKQGGPHTEEGGGLAVHVGNVLHGGSIGIEIRPLAPLQGILEHAKKFIPGHGGYGTVGRPSHEIPDHEDRPNQERPNEEYPKHHRPPYHERPHKDQPPYERPHEDRPNYERPSHEYPKHDRPPYHERPHKEQNQQRPGHQRPNTDQPTKEDHKEWEEAKDPGRPQWEDIGEVPSGEEEEEYGEGVLQPRVRRPKRFVESKIYHVPLLFRSNGRAERVRIKGRNGLRERKNSEY